MPAKKYCAWGVANLMSEEALRRRVLQDPVAFFMEWVRLGERHGAWAALQARRLGPFCDFNDRAWRVRQRPNRDYVERIEYVTIAEDIAEARRRDASRGFGGA